MSRTRAFKLPSFVVGEEAAPECLVCGVARTANNPSMSANSRGKIKTKFRFQCGEAGELAISARMFCRPGRLSSSAHGGPGACLFLVHHPIRRAAAPYRIP